MHVLRYYGTMLCIHLYYNNIIKQHIMNNNIIIDKDLKNEIQTMIQQGTGIDYKSGTCYTPNFDLRELIIP